MIEEWQMDMQAFNLWRQGIRGDNVRDIRAMQKALPVILSEYVTPTQKKYILEYFVEKRNLIEIGKIYGVCPSTVSKGIHSGLRNIYNHIRFVSPLFLNVPQGIRRLSQNRGGVTHGDNADDGDLCDRDGNTGRNDGGDEWRE